MTEVQAELERWRDRGDEHAALATVVATRFSAPRPVGSKLAVSEQGELAGSVSGGCVESEVATVAREVLASGDTRALTYGITDEQAGTVGLPVRRRDRRDDRADRAQRAGELRRGRAAPAARLRRRRHRRVALPRRQRARLAHGGRRPAREVRHSRPNRERRRALRRVARGSPRPSRAGRAHRRRRPHARGALRHSGARRCAAQRRVLRRRDRLAADAGEAGARGWSRKASPRTTSSASPARPGSTSAPRPRPRLPSRSWPRSSPCERAAPVAG